MLNSALAPIAVFAYRRTIHLSRTLDALERCPEFSQSPVFIFSDGPKNGAAKDDVVAVRALIRARLRPNMQIVETPENRGLAASIIAGVSRLCDEFGRVIVIEDDLIVTPCALTWFNRALIAHAFSPNVFHINAYQHRVPEFWEMREGIFTKFVGSWGWATWGRAWKQFDFDAIGWKSVRDNAQMRYAFDLNGSYPFSDMLISQMTGKSDSWAIRWCWTIFKSDALALSPPKALVSNIGLDETATHNSLGRFKKFFSPAKSPLWQRDYPPDQPTNYSVDAINELAFQAALVRTRAMRNARIKMHFSRIKKLMQA